MNKFKTFKNLHHQQEPLILGNVWDVQSAILFQKLGYKAIGTSSAAIATSLGYEDGEKMPFSDLLWIVKKIQSKISIPLSVDLEGGYSRNTSEIISNIESLYKLGVVGINIEDSITTDKRKIINTQDFGEIIREIKNYLTIYNIELFLNIRTDFYIMGLENPLKETIKRIKNYTRCGADGIFVPCVVEENEIQKIAAATSLPINVMCMPNLANFKALENMGVKRISIGPFLYNNIALKIENTIKQMVEEQSFQPLFN